jgi:hypothetical protein
MELLLQVGSAWPSLRLPPFAIDVALVEVVVHFLEKKLGIFWNFYKKVSSDKNCNPNF